ncbi:hypothetical protein [Aquimarina megaterium]|uniref:hypothetical protein n=1 Tax=Aquimarina megaterium TaxID=1443666 RepID=UPI000944C68B|nr:hypothetical protein [Aquimarina megaterium]
MKFYLKYYWRQLKKWCYLHLTPKGRKEKFFAEGLSNINVHLEDRKKEAKLNMQLTAGSILGQKKIIGYTGKKSITKPKTTNHKLKKAVENRHAKELKDNKLKIQDKTLIIQDA